MPRAEGRVEPYTFSQKSLAKKHIKQKKSKQNSCAEQKNNNAELESYNAELKNKSEE